MGKHINGRNFDWEAFKRGKIPRICYKCKTPKYSDQFREDPKRRHGYEHSCIACVKERQYRHYERNREQYIERLNQWKRDHPDAVKTASQAYRAENLERIREKDRRWRAANIEKNRARQREYNRLRLWQDKAAANCNKRALDKGVPRGMTGDDLLDPQTGNLPKFCPIFPHIKLDYSQGPDRRCWASVDRKVPELGYTSGNVWVVSMAANTWKNNGSNPSERAIISRMMTSKKPAPKPIDGQIPLF